MLDIYQVQEATVHYIFVTVLPPFVCSSPALEYELSHCSSTFWPFRMWTLVHTVWFETKLSWFLLCYGHCKYVPPSFTASLLGRENLIHSDVEVMFYMEQGLAVLFPPLLLSAVYWLNIGWLYVSQSCCGFSFNYDNFSRTSVSQGQGCES